MKCSGGVRGAAWWKAHSEELPTRTEDIIISRLPQILQAQRTHKNTAQRELLQITQEMTESDRRIRELEEALERETKWAVSRGEIVPTYKVLGRGAWGRIVEGTFRGCQVAVKEMHHVLVSQHNIDIFRREINTQRKCRHPNIVMMIAATNQHRIPLIVTELMYTSLRYEVGGNVPSTTHEETYSFSTSCFKRVTQHCLCRPHHYLL